MFKDSLFSILSEEKSDSQATLRIRLNANHPIYTGHFPGDAITPGVCIVQIAVDLFSHLQGNDYRLVAAKNVKFINIIKPNEHPEVNYQLNWDKNEAGDYTLKGVVAYEDKTFTKISVTVKIQDPTI